MEKFNPKLYEILGRLPHDTSQDEIKKAYRAFAKIYHPDKNPNDIVYAKEMMSKINEAYETLSNPVKREEYNKKLIEYNNIRENHEKIINERKKQEKEKHQKARTKYYSQNQNLKTSSPLSGIVNTILFFVILTMLFSAFTDKK